MLPPTSEGVELSLSTIPKYYHDPGVVHDDSTLQIPGFWKINKKMCFNLMQKWKGDQQQRGAIQKVIKCFLN